MYPARVVEVSKVMMDLASRGDSPPRLTDMDRFLRVEKNRKRPVAVFRWKFYSGHCGPSNALVVLSQPITEFKFSTENFRFQ